VSGDVEADRTLVNCCAALATAVRWHMQPV